MADDDVPEFMGVEGVGEHDPIIEVTTTDRYATVYYDMHPTGAKLTEEARSELTDVVQRYLKAAVENDENNKTRDQIRRVNTRVEGLLIEEANDFVDELSDILNDPWNWTPVGPDFVYSDEVQERITS